MIYRKPYFYDDFKCKADKCTDTCCAGWEVDIDSESYKKYKTVGGRFGTRLIEGIDFTDGQACFKLCKNDRCIFLDNNGLCDIYSELGEEYLCEICREHPRFYDFFDGITEMGLGLCCEKVCELMFSSEKPVTFESYEEDFDSDVNDEDKLYFFIREKCFEIIYDRKKSLHDRIIDLIEYAVSVQNDIFADEYVFNSSKNIKDMAFAVVKIFTETEAINDEWDIFIKETQDNFEKIFSVRNDVELKEYEYEQILTYILYRHFMKSRFCANILHPVCFSIISIIFIFLCDCKTFSEKNYYDKSDRIYNVKLWSKQIEYSEENTQYLFDKSLNIILTQQ